MVNEKNLGLSAGIVGGFGLFFATLFSIFTGLATDFLVMVSDFYPGYSITIIGAIIGFVYALIDCFVFGYVFGWIYNYLEKKK
ncbi:bacteriophage holin [Candidatus Micrarchaeota archaeon]|nr:bacteriophage holin [Candidatus Micrarchaeota archaeon]